MWFCGFQKQSLIESIWIKTFRSSVAVGEKTIINEYSSLPSDNIRGRARICCAIWKLIRRYITAYALREILLWVYSFTNKAHLKCGSVVFTNNMHRVLIETETLIIETIWGISGMIHWTKPGQNFHIDALNLPGNSLKAIYILEAFHQSKTFENVERILDAIKANHRREKLKIWKLFGKYPAVFNKLDCSFFTSHVIIPPPNNK